MCSDYVQNSDFPKIGGEGKVIEMDESIFGSRKHHKGRVIEGKWVVGAVQVDDKTKCFFEPVENRSSKTYGNNLTKHCPWYHNCNRLLGRL